MLALKKIDETILALLSEKAEVQYKELKKKLLSSDYKEITLIRHLKGLEEDGVIKRMVKEDRSVWYSVSDKVKMKAEVLNRASHLIKVEPKTSKKIPLRVKVPKIPPFPIIESLIGDIREDDPLYSTKVGFGRALYEGLEKSASGSIFSDLEPDKVDLDKQTCPLAELYIDVLMALLNGQLKRFDDYTKSLANDLEKRLRDRTSQVFWEKIKSGEEDPKLMSERFLKDELLPEETRAILQSVKDVQDAEKEVVRRLIDTLNFQFHVVITFDGEELVKSLREYDKRLDILWREPADYLFKLIKERTLRMCRERLSKDLKLVPVKE